MQIIIPMVGSGERFRSAGYKEPKPLIKVHGRPIIEYVVNLFPGEENFLFIVGDEDLKKTGLKKVLFSLKPRAKVMGIASHKRGPVFTLAQSVDYIEDKEPVIVNYCDFFMYWDYGDFKKTMKKEDPASCSSCYKGFHPHLLGQNFYAGVRLDPDRQILEVREKHSFTPDKMDTWQQTGTFYFRSGELLKKYSEKLLASGESLNGEYYASLLYNPMIEDGLRCTIYPVEYFCQWGTPEDLAEYNGWADAVQSGLATPTVLKLDSSRYGKQESAELALRYWQEFFFKNPFYWD